MDDLLKSLHDAGWPPWVVASAAALYGLYVLVRPILAVFGLARRFHKPALPTVADLFADLKASQAARVDELDHRAKRAEEKADKAEEKAEHARRATALCEAAHHGCMAQVEELTKRLDAMEGP